MSKNTDSLAVVVELRARAAAVDARQAAQQAFASKAPADILRASDRYRLARSLYERAAGMWRKLGPERRTFAEHCARMATRLAASPFARRDVGRLEST